MLYFATLSVLPQVSKSCSWNTKSTVSTATILWPSVQLHCLCTLQCTELMIEEIREYNHQYKHIQYCVTFPLISLLFFVCNQSLGFSAFQCKHHTWPFSLRREIEQSEGTLLIPLFFRPGSHPKATLGWIRENHKKRVGHSLSNACTNIISLSTALSGQLLRALH